MTSDCQHEFEIDFSIPVMDMAPDGIKTGRCKKCGAIGQLGPRDKDGWRFVRFAEPPR